MNQLIFLMPSYTEFLPSPDLDCLIKACGDNFGSLTKAPDLKWFKAIDRDVNIIAEGDLSDEAVARLWLGLNKK
jgi:hypothetical protein